MKFKIYLFLEAFTNLIINVSFIWTIVLFILYLVKDLPFKWTSLTVLIIASILNALLETKIDYISKKIIIKPEIKNSSKFKEKLDKAMKDLSEQKSEFKPQ